jgi:hypothetical protein
MIASPLIGKLHHLRNINQARVTTWRPPNCCMFPNQERSRLPTSLSNRVANMSHRPHSINRLIVYAYLVFAATMAGTFSAHLCLKHLFLTAVFHHHNSTFGYFLRHNHCTTAYQQYLRGCIIATTFPLSPWARTRFAARTSRGKTRRLYTATVAPASLLHRHLQMELS